ncbi:MAG: hypothetical protein KatS3mg125_0049 [Lysobacterales bacterium]|nr:MAG: hypothetical protein KatS3mg125_0049 [Xanthomonadales bacterium]
MSLRVIIIALLVVSFGEESAAARLFRCVSAAGTPIFTDRPCHMLDASPATSSSTPELRAPAEPEPPPEPDPIPGLCPAPNAERLQRAVERAFARRRVNDLAALYHWVGSTRASSVAVMDRLAELLRHPLAEVAFDPPFAESEWSEDESRLPDLRLELRQSRNEEETFSVWFRLRRHAGCLWLSF